jgi:hypothetical protein
MLLRFDSTVFKHPLGARSELDYRFQTGDSTVIRLPDGRSVQLRELRFVPRRSERGMITGSFWLDLATHAVVQAYFRPVGVLFGNVEGGGGSPYFAQIGRDGFGVRGQVQVEYIAIDYGLWDFTWWLPRTVAMRSIIEAAGVRVPVSYERVYDDYTVTGDTTAAVATSVETAPPGRLCRPGVSFSVQIGTEAVPDSVRLRRERETRARRDSVRAVMASLPDSLRGRGGGPCMREFIVTQASDSVLLNSALLTADIYTGEPLLNADELRTIARRVAAAANPISLDTRFWWGVGAPDLTRYNRVEGLSTGVRAAWTLGPYSAEAEARIGTADREPRGHLSLARIGSRFTTTATAYRRLDALEFSSRPLGTSTLARGFLLGDDDHDYFQTTGADLRIQPLPARLQWYDLRLFAEAQRAVHKHTDASLIRLFDDDQTFRDNIAADRANQAGATLRVRAAQGLDPEATRFAAALELHGETGDYSFLRPSLTLRASNALGPIALGVEAGAGTNFGSAPVQRYWQLGGTSTLRGYSAVSLRGEAFWRARAEAGFGLPVVRLTLFGDAGWAGARDAFVESKPLRAVGVGFGVMDGLVRLDVARALDAPRRWKLHLHFGGLF